MIRKYLYGFFLAGIILSSSCKKGPGEGGTSSIRGKVLMLDYNGNYPVLDTSYYKEEEDVYIVYGEGDTYDDRFRTSYDGSYEFKYLRKGTYKVFVYSDDSTGLSPSGKITVVQTIDIDKNKETYDVPDLVIVKN
jgi:hypothetical protein